MAIARLREAVARFRARQGRNPVALEELVRTAELDAVPVDPGGAPYAYDRATGRVGDAADAGRAGPP